MKKSLKFFLEEDECENDVTSSLVPEGNCTGEVVAGEDGVLAGIDEARELFLSKGLEVEFSRLDGEEFHAGEVIIRVSGQNRALLSVIRTVLNLMGRMSGVATLCREAESIAGRCGARTAVTRKTVPGMRELDKKAARIGGSWPHRKHLNDMVLFKKGHLVHFKSITEAVNKAKAVGDKKIEVEATSLAEALEAARSGADMVMLDNFSVAEAGKAIGELRAYPVKIEVSGGITLENLDEYARLKPDFVSMGCLTKSARMIDFSLRITS